MIKTIDRFFAVAGAIGFIQFPALYQQYLHELSGHVKELKYQVGLIEHAALISHKTTSEWIAKFSQSIDPDFALQGKILKNMIGRLDSFLSAETALTQSSLVSKPFFFLKHLNWEILSDTFKSFQFSFPISFEGFAYALFGLVAGFSFFHALYWFIKKASLAFITKEA